MDTLLTRAQVATASAEMAPDVVVKLWEDEITPRLADLIHSQHSWENFGGVSAIGAFSFSIISNASSQKYQIYCWRFLGTNQSNQRGIYSDSTTT